MGNIDPNLAKQTVIEAFEKFGETRRLSEPNEAETRCDLIDRILTAVGWESGGFDREVSTGTGDYVDYVLPCSPHPTLVIEAKRSGASFTLDEAKFEAGRTRALTTLLRTGGKSLKDALKQAAGYCNDKAIPYACITNGYQWIFFRGLSSEAQSWNDGRAIVFPSSESLTANFDEFLACLAPHKVVSSELSRQLARPTPQEIPRSIIPCENLTLRRKPVSVDLLDLRRAIGLQFFAQIHGVDRSKMLAKCYVEPGDRPDFNRSLQRLLNDTLSSDTVGGETVYEGNTKAFVDQLQSLDISGKIKYPILVVGNVGVGKTTFLYRTLAALREVHKVSADEKNVDYKTKGDAAIFAYVDLENQGNFEDFDDQEIQRQTAALILEKLTQSAISTLKKRDDVSENARNEADPANETTLKTMLRDCLFKERSSSESYFKRNPEQWDHREYELIQEYRRDAITFLIHYIRHLRARFKRRDELKYPILLVLDNLDQASSKYQRCIYGLALRLAKETPAVAIVSIRQDTFNDGRQSRGFLSSSPLEFVFHVQAPALDQLLRQRVKYIRHCLENNNLPKGFGNSSEEIIKVVDIITKGLLDSPREGLEVVSALSGHNIRSALDIVREFISGTTLLNSTPEPTVDYLLEALIAMAGQLDHQLDLKKIFDADPHVPPLHALRLRLLGYYSWAYESHPDRSLLEATESVIAKFAAWGYPAHSVEQALKALSSQGLLTSVKENSETLSIRMSISSIGYAHIARLALQKVYRTAMALISRWYAPDLAQEFIRQAAEAGTEEGTSLSDIVAANSVTIFEAYLGAARVREDKLLSEKFSIQSWVQETLSRSNSWDVNLLPCSQYNQEKLNQKNLEIEQLSFDVTLQPELLPRLPRNLKLHSSVWIPRILWALEYAAINRKGPLTAAKIAKILTEEGDMDVPDTNVARAFRDFRGKPDIEVYFARHGKRYSITKEGSAIIRSCIQTEYSDNDE
ncbi:MAG: hypothetical protein KME07_11820 [Pegethrix bostrychoides GSE-TBD4-15B]|jgi:GTPase SAR1 family protein|uniref:Uncharacterized protein n=1 Tax=Pegethrix bostrychoides GSE-TBD4-15B TaxID=2839662 RepID=A0A951U4V4_9CYAN|nr:hypothetical protein [Pegethrix bostrychoides GSE-TBD4-15B]